MRRLRSVRALLRQQRPDAAHLDFNGPNRLGGLLAAGPGAERRCKIPNPALRLYERSDRSSDTRVSPHTRRVGGGGLWSGVHRFAQPCARRSGQGTAGSSRLNSRRQSLHDPKCVWPTRETEGTAATANVLRHFGFGVPDVEEVRGCISSGATLWAEGAVGENDGQLFRLPLPACLSGVRGVRKLSVTLAWPTPVQPGRRAYKGVGLKVEEPEFKSVCSRALEGQSERKPRGTM